MSSASSAGQPPRIVTEPDEIRRAVQQLRAEGKRVGLVPTMGALHAGHLSLVEAARQTCAATVVTIFVNPTQFGPGEDLDKYPRQLEADVALLAERQTDLVFAPPESAVYRPGHETYVEVGSTAEPLEGGHRPGHFRGVATVVLKLFQMVPADVAFFGQKDYQQTLVVQRMVEDFDLPIEIEVCPIVREPDGLALSSRNVYLSADQRRDALAISQSLKLAQQHVADGVVDAQQLLGHVRQRLASTPGVAVEYVALVEAGTVTPIARIEGPAVLAIAAQVGSTRLIDNCRLVPPDGRTE